jgi:hypothetical protein
MGKKCFVGLLGYSLQPDGKTCMLDSCPLNFRPYGDNSCIIDCPSQNYITKDTHLYCTGPYNSTNSTSCELPWVKNGAKSTTPSTKCINYMIGLNTNIYPRDKRTIPPYTFTDPSDTTNRGFIIPLKYNL